MAFDRSDDQWLFDAADGNPTVVIDANNSSVASFGEGTLRLINPSSGHYMGFDSDDIQVWDEDETKRKLYLNDYGGDVRIGLMKRIYYIESSDRVGIGTTTPDQLLDVSGTTIIRDSLAIGKQDPDFTLDVVGSGNFTGELTAASDARLKKDVVKIDDASTILAALRPVSYDFNTEDYPEMGLSQGKRYGLIAQEVEQVLPELVANKIKGQTPDGEDTIFKSVNYMDLISILIKGNQEQQDEIAELKQVREALLEEEKVLERQLVELEKGF